MRSLNKNILCLVAGAVLGAVPAWYFTKKKYCRVMKEAIEDVKDTYHKRRIQDMLADKDQSKPPLEDLVKKFREEVEAEEEDLEEAKNIIEENGYSENGTYSGFDRPPLEDRLNAVPYVISPEMFGEVYGAGNTRTLTYYSNGVLVDDIDGMVEDIETTIGFDALQHFGEYEQNIVHVRNDRYMTDIEVCYDPGTYDDVGGINEPSYNPEDDFDEVD